MSDMRFVCAIRNFDFDDVCIQLKCHTRVDNP